MRLALRCPDLRHVRVSLTSEPRRHAEPDAVLGRIVVGALAPRRLDRQLQPPGPGPGPGPGAGEPPAQAVVAARRATHPGQRPCRRRRTRGKGPTPRTGCPPTTTPAPSSSAPSAHPSPRRVAGRRGGSGSCARPPDPCSSAPHEGEGVPPATGGEDSGGRCEPRRLSRRMERPRAPAHAPLPLPWLAAEDRPSSARRLIGRRRRRRTPDKPRPAEPPSGPGQAYAAGAPVALKLGSRLSYLCRHKTFFM